MSDIDLPSDALGRCYAAGPCESMRHRIQDGTVYCYERQLYLCNGAHVIDCPWCGGAVSPATLATWRHDVLHPPKAAA